MLKSAKSLECPIPIQCSTQWFPNTSWDWTVGSSEKYLTVQRLEHPLKLCLKRHILHSWEKQMAKMQGCVSSHLPLPWSSVKRQKWAKDQDMTLSTLSPCCFFPGEKEPSSPAAIIKARHSPYTNCEWNKLGKDWCSISPTDSHHPPVHFKVFLYKINWHNNLLDPRVHLLEVGMYF